MAQSTVPSGAVALRRLALIGMLLCLVVVVLGAWVRLTDAGLGCPDWPGCYGHVTPAGAERTEGKIESYSPGWEYDSGKAWREMVHRYAAITLGFVIVLIAATAIAYHRERPVSLPFALSLLSVVLLQGALGAFTVWWLVKPLVVVLHLVGGLTTLSLLTWLWLSMRRVSRVIVAAAGTTKISALDGARDAAVAATAIVACQIMLGGWTSSNYAAVACPDLPKCQNQWWPEGMDFNEAFVLWRGLDINYTGGVLEHPARVAIHFTHRLGALIATLAVLLAGWLAIRNAPTTLVRRGGQWAIAALGLQLLIAVFMILQAFPLSLAAGHNAGAAILLMALLLLNKRLRET
ncbi:MAG: heme A synthase [Gammaproteobacteria bacterium]|nr:heme A synthase [Gammaproteobacteria bacterium]